MLNEKIIVDDIEYPVENVSTGLNFISFVVHDMDMDTAESTFKNVTSILVGAEGEIYGEYPNVKFESISKNISDKITITMHILTDIEKQYKELEISQAEQDEAIAELMFGGKI